MRAFSFFRPWISSSIFLFIPWISSSLFFLSISSSLLIYIIITIGLGWLVFVPRGACISLLVMFIIVTMWILEKVSFWLHCGRQNVLTRLNSSWSDFFIFCFRSSQLPDSGIFQSFHFCRMHGGNLQRYSDAQVSPCRIYRCESWEVTCGAWLSLLFIPFGWILDIMSLLVRPKRELQLRLNHVF